MAVSLKLAEAFVDISVDMSKFTADLSKVRAALAGLGGLGGGGLAAAVAQGMASGMAQGAARGSGPAGIQMRNALGQFTSQGVAQGIASGMAGARSSAAPLGQAVQQAVAQGMTAGAAQGAARWQSQARNAFGQFTAGGGGGGAGGGAGGGPGFGPSFGAGALQGLGVSGFAINPAMALGSMAGGGIRAGWGMVAEGLKESARTAMDVQSTFIDIQRVTGESAGNVDRFKHSMFDLAARQAGVSFADVGEIALGGAKAGIPFAGLERYTVGLAKLKNALGDKEGLDTSKMTDQMSRMLVLFGKGPEAVEGFGSALTRLANVSTASAGGILDTTMGLAGTFASMKTDAAEAMSVASVITDVGLKNQMGAGAMTKILRDMASDSAKYAEAIGMPLEQFQQTLRTDLIGAFNLVINKFKELNDLDPIRGQEFVKAMGWEGVRVGAAFQQMAMAAGQMKERAAMAREEMAGLGALTAADALKSEAAAGGVLKLANAFTELKNAVGENLLPPLSAATEALTDLTRATAGNMPTIVGAAGMAGRVAAGAIGGAPATAAMGVFPWLMGRLFGPESAPALPGRATGMLVGPPRPDLGGARAGGLAAVAAENERRQAEAAARLKARFLPSAADIAAAEEEVGPAREGAKGKVSAADEKEHAEAVFRHAQRIQGERQAKEAAEAMAIPVEKRTREQAMVVNEDAARDLGVQISHYGRMAFGALFAQPGEKAGIAAGLAGKGLGALGEATGHPLAGAARAFAGLGLDLDAKKPKPFQSQAFTDPADFARHAIQEALSDKDQTPKEALKEHKLAVAHLAAIRETLGGKGRKHGGLVLDE